MALPRLFGALALLPELGRSSDGGVKASGSPSSGVQSGTWSGSAEEDALADTSDFVSLLATSLARFRIASHEAAVAATDCGPVTGAWDADFGTYAFRGIPYAVPRVGPWRWKRSELLSVGGGCWQGTLDTSSRNDSYMDTQRCAQNPRDSWLEGLAWDGVEDCLTLDVRSPMTDLQTLRPVLVMIHGGSLVNGVPDIPYALRHEGFVVVGVRYRLNLLGFLAAHELSEQDPKHASGNYGFSDQVTALQWVQRNAKAFGGDPSQVTIMGCSAGGSSIWNLLAIPSARGLFASAIPMSAASKNSMTLAEAERQNSVFVQRLCSGAANKYDCLMALSLESVMRGFMDMAGPNFPHFDHPDDFELPSGVECQAGVCIVDGVVVVEDLHMALREQASHSQVPVLSGSCSQEGNSASLTRHSTVRDFESVVTAFVHGLSTAVWPVDAVQRIMDLYPPDSPEFSGMPKAAVDAMVADIRVVCGCIFNAERLVESHMQQKLAAPADIWLYYADMTANDGNEMEHCSTLSTLTKPSCSQCSVSKAAFYANMVRVHSDFVRTGRPPVGLRRITDSPTYARGDFILNTIGPNITISTSRLKDRCDFWQETRILDQYAWVEL